MKALAVYVMRGRVQATLVAAALVLLALTLMPLSWPFSFFSGAVVGLVTLVKGNREGLFVLLGGLLLMVLLGTLTPGHPLAVASYALVVWLLVWVLAVALRQSVSLNLTLLLGSLLGMMAVGGFFLFTGDPADWWYQHFTTEVLPILEKAGMVFDDRARLNTELQQASQLLTGSLSAFLLLGAIAGLFIARRWQAGLYNPGGFQSEFYQLRFGVTATLVALAMLAVMLVSSGFVSALLSNMLQPVMLIFLFQGLAIAHALVSARSLNSSWLVAIYMLLLFALPYSPVLLALLGMADNWLDLRSKFGHRKAGGTD